MGKELKEHSRKLISEVQLVTLRHERACFTCVKVKVKKSITVSTKVDINLSLKKVLRTGAKSKRK